MKFFINYKNKLLLTLACVSVSYLGFNFGRSLFLEYEYYYVYSEPTQEVFLLNLEETIPDVVILENTSIIKRHIDSITGEISETVTRAQPQLHGINASTFAGIFTEWDLISFSEREVIAQRHITSQQTPNYMLSILHGFLTIHDIEGRLLEVTAIPTNHLNESELERLEGGIFVLDENELIRRLEDYSS